MQKNRIQIATMVLGAILLLVVLIQGMTIQALQTECVSLREQTETAKKERETLTEQMEQTTAVIARIQKQREQPVPSVYFANSVWNAGEGMLRVDIIVQSPEPLEENRSFGLCQPGDPYERAWFHESFSKKDDGTLHQTVVIPLERDTGLEIRLEDDTVLYSGNSMAELLPVQLKDCGSSWHFDSKLHLFYQHDQSVQLITPEGNPVTATDMEFRYYRNDRLVHTGTAKVKEDHVAAVGGEENLGDVRLNCEPGDRLRLTFACTDQFGLSYEFPLWERVGRTWDDMEQCPISTCPTVRWTK